MSFKKAESWREDEWTENPFLNKSCICPFFTQRRVRSREMNSLHRRCLCCYLKLPDSCEIKYDDGQGHRQRKLRQIGEEVMIKNLCESV